MNKKLLSLFTVLFCLLGFASVPVWGQVQVTQPTSGSTVPSTFNVTINPYPDADYIRVRIRTPSTGTSLVGFGSSGQAFSPGGTLTATLTLATGQTYDLRVDAYDGNGDRIPGSEVVVSNITVAAPAPPIVTSPENGATNLNACGTNLVNVNNYPGASAVRVFWRRTSGASPEATFDQTRSVTDNAAPFSLSLTQLQPDETYELNVYAGNLTGTPPNQNFNAVSPPAVLTISTDGIPNANPVITSPANGATGVSLNPTITIGAYTGECGVVTSQVSIAIDPDGDFVPGSPGYQIGNVTANPNGTYNATFSQPLQGGTTYRVRATFPVEHNGKTVLYQNIGERTFTTFALPVITTPTANATNVSPCGVDVLVQPYTGAASMEVRYTVGTVVGETFDWGIVEAVYTAPRRADGTFAVFIPPTTNLFANTAYTIRVVAIDNFGNQIQGAISYVTFTTGQPPSFLPVLANEEATTEAGARFVTVPSNRTSGGATDNVSTDVVTSPTFKVGAYTGCTNVFTNLSIEIAEVGDPSVPAPPTFPEQNKITEIDLFSTGPYEYTFPNNALEPNIKYQARITFYANYLTGTKQYNQPHDGENSIIITFITGTGLGQSFATNVDPVNPYLNAYNQVLSGQRVSGATHYRMQLSRDNGFTQVHLDQTISVPNINTPINFSFRPNDGQLQSGEQYFVRVKALSLDAGNNILGEGPWSTGSNIKSVYNSLHPLFISRPTGTSARTTKLVANGVVGNSDAAIFQLYRDNGDGVLTAGDPVANFACYFRPCPTITDPVNGQVAYLGDWARNVIGIPQWTYDYVQDMEVGATYHLVVKAVRRGGPNGYLQPGYYLPTNLSNAYSTFTVTNSGRLGISWDQTVLFPNPFNEETKILLPDGIKTVKIKVTDLSGKVVEERSYTDLGGDSVPLGRTWRKGVYIVQLLADGQPLENMKVVKQ